MNKWLDIRDAPMGRVVLISDGRYIENGINMSGTWCVINNGEGPNFDTSCEIQQACHKYMPPIAWMPLPKPPDMRPFDPWIPMEPEERGGYGWPCDPDTRVDIKFRDETIVLDQRVRDWDWTWSPCGLDEEDIVGWRLANCR